MTGWHFSSILLRLCLKVQYLASILVDIPVTTFDSNWSESDPQLQSSHLVPLFEGIVSSLSYYWFSSCLGRAVGIVPPFPAWRSDLPSSDSWLITNIWWVSVDQNGLTVLKCGIFNLFSAVELSWILPSCGHCPLQRIVNGPILWLTSIKSTPLEGSLSETRMG